MIGTLEEAWNWYQAARRISRAIVRLGKDYWDHLPWDGDMGRDNLLQDLESTQVESMSLVVLGDLDDLCVLLLFSVFEATVRERALADVVEELPVLHHPALVQAMATLKDSIGHGSFYRVLDPYKGMDADLVEGVNQVRRYRNWVAHGRRGVPTENVSPDVAYQRLKRFLDGLEAPR